MGIWKSIEIMESSMKNSQKIKQRIAMWSRYTIEYYADLKKKKGNPIISYNRDELGRHYAKQKKEVGQKRTSTLWVHSL